jgi:hypothetical protein
MAPKYLISFPFFQFVSRKKAKKMVQQTWARGLWGDITPPPVSLDIQGVIKRFCQVVTENVENVFGQAQDIITP